MEIFVVPTARPAKTTSTTEGKYLTDMLDKGRLSKEDIEKMVKSADTFKKSHIFYKFIR